MEKKLKCCKITTNRFFPTSSTWLPALIVGCQKFSYYCESYIFLLSNTENSAMNQHNKPISTFANPAFAT